MDNGGKEDYSNSNAIIDSISHIWYFMIGPYISSFIICSKWVIAFTIRDNIKKTDTNASLFHVFALYFVRSMIWKCFSILGWICIRADNPEIAPVDSVEHQITIFCLLFRFYSKASNSQCVVNPLEIRAQSCPLRPRNCTHMIAHKRTYFI